MVWETKRHEETIAFNQRRIQSLQDELATLCQDKGMADAKLMELDQLVGQLLAVNESLVAQLTGRPLKHEVRVKAKKAKKKNAPLPRAAGLTTVSTDASKVTKFAQRSHQKLVQVQNEDVEALTSMHKMYANIAKSLKKSTGTSSPARSTGRRSAASTPGSAVSGKGKLMTRLSRKKAQLIEQFNQEARDSIMHNEHSAPASYSHSQSAPSSARGAGHHVTPRGSMEVRLPKPSASYDPTNESHLNVSGEFDDYYQRNSALQQSFLNHTQPAGSAHVSFTQADMSSVVGNHGHSNGHAHHHVDHNTSMNSQYPNEGDFHTGLPPRASHSTSAYLAPQPNNRSDMKNVIDSLEKEFDQLNMEYRKLLSNVQSGSQDSSAGTSVGLNRETPVVTPESIQAQAEEIVSVIQKLHKKGEQIRTLKSSSP